MNAQETAPLPVRRHFSGARRTWRRYCPHLWSVQVSRVPVNRVVFPVFSRQYIVMSICCAVFAYLQNVYLADSHSDKICATHMRALFNLSKLQA